MSQTVAEIIADNLHALKQDRRIASDNALAKLAHVDQKTIWRILHKEQSPTVDTLEKLARPFGLHAWQLLIPRLDPKNPPVFVMSDAERNLYAKMASMAAEFVAHEPQKKYEQ